MPKSSQNQTSLLNDQDSAPGCLDQDTELGRRSIASQHPARLEASHISRKMQKGHPLQRAPSMESEMSSLCKTSRVSRIATDP